jgi:hypothetical protein
VRLKPHLHCLVFSGAALRGKIAKEEGRKNALAANRRGTGKKLGGPETDDSPGLSNGRREADLHQRNSRSSQSNWRSGVHGDANGAMISNGCVGVEVRHLNDRQEREQHQTQNGDHRQ